MVSAVQNQQYTGQIMTEMMQERFLLLSLPFDTPNPLPRA